VPEHSGRAIAADLADFWTWFRAGGVTAFLASLPPSRDLQLDYDRVLVTGDSAGGYMALMSALTQPRGAVRAVLAQYPMTWYLRREQADGYLDGPAPGPGTVDEHVAAIVPGSVVSCATPPARMGLSYTLSAFGRYREFFGEDEKLWPLGLIEEREWAPPTWIIHGDKDAAVSVEDSRLFVKKWKERGMGNEVRLEVREGQDHGFDVGMKESEEEWLRDGLAWVEGKWLG
tara:strand:+ start:18596 stop:19285 length:690 start_codon:yes stop_codon:yes gene_type:complete